MALRASISSLFESTSQFFKLSCDQVVIKRLPIEQFSGHRNPNRCLHTSCRIYAGHSKWQNIKHIKAAHDKQKGLNAQLLVQKMQQVLSRNPETDPKLNTELANLIKWARTNNITNDTVERTLDRMSKLRDPKAITVLDGRGPSNTGVVIEVSSLKPQHTESVIQGMVKKYGFNLKTSASDLFTHTGVLDVNLREEDLPKASSDPEGFSLDKYIDLAIEAGAEEVTLESSPDGPYVQFTCPPWELPQVGKHLEDAGLTVVNAERAYIPTTVVPVSQDFIEVLGKMSDKLDLQPEVMKYYFNVEPES